MACIYTRPEISTLIIRYKQLYINYYEYDTDVYGTKQPYTFTFPAYLSHRSVPVEFIMNTAQYKSRVWTLDLYKAFDLHDKSYR